jgi:hypothetical protein
MEEVVLVVVVGVGGSGVVVVGCGGNGVAAAGGDGGRWRRRRR